MGLLGICRPSGMIGHQVSDRRDGSLSGLEKWVDRTRRACR